jgi:hypothetical protein
MAPAPAAAPAAPADSAVSAGTDYSARLWSAFAHDFSQPAYSPPAANAPASSRRSHPTLTVMAQWISRDNRGTQSSQFIFGGDVILHF